MGSSHRVFQRFEVNMQEIRLRTCEIRNGYHHSTELSELQKSSWPNPPGCKTNWLYTGGRRGLAPRHLGADAAGQDSYWQPRVGTWLLNQELSTRPCFISQKINQHLQLRTAAWLGSSAVVKIDRVIQSDGYKFVQPCFDGGIAWWNDD